MQLEHPAAGTTTQAAQIRPVGLVWDRANRQVFADLSAAMLQPKPVVALIGAPGSGKSALLKDWASECRGAVHIARPGPMGDDADSVMGAVAVAFEVSQDALGTAAASVAGGQDKNATTAALRAKLTAMLDRGEIPVLMIDDADRLGASTIELLRLFSGIRHGGVPLLRLVLAGRPELRSKLKLDDPRAAHAVTVLEMPTLDSDAAEALAGRVIREVTGGQAELELGVTATIARHGPATPGALRAAAEKVGRAAREGGWTRISAERAGQILGGGAVNPVGDAAAAASGVAALMAAAAGGEVKAKPVGGPAAAAPVAMPSDIQMPDMQPETAPAPTSEAPVEAAAPEAQDVVDVPRDAGVLPKSIGDAEDPRTLLRWAFGLKNDEAAKPTKPVAPPHALAEPTASAAGAEPVNTPSAALSAPRAPAADKTAPAADAAQKATAPAAASPQTPVAKDAAPADKAAPRTPRFGNPTPAALEGKMSARNPGVRHAFDGPDTDEMRFPETDEDLSAALRRVVEAEEAERKSGTRGGAVRPSPATAPAAPTSTPAPAAKATPVPSQAEPTTPASEASPRDVLGFDDAHPAPQTIGNTLGTTPEGGRIISSDLPPLATHRPDDIQERHDQFEANERFLREAFALPEERTRNFGALYFVGAVAAGLAIGILGLPMLRSALDTPFTQTAGQGASDDIPAISLGTAGDGGLLNNAGLGTGSGDDGPALTAIIEEIKSPAVDDRVVVSGFASLDGTGVRVPAQNFDPPVVTAARTPDRLSGPDVGETPQIQPNLGGVPTDLGGAAEGLTSEDFAALVSAKASLEAEIRALATQRDTIVSEIPVLQQQAASLAGQSAELDAQLAETRAQVAQARAQAQADVDTLAARSEDLAGMIAKAAAELSAREATLAEKASDISRLASEAEAAAARRDAITTEVATLSERRDEIAAVQALAASRDDVAAEIAELEAQRVALNGDLEASRTELAEQTEAVAALRGEVSSLTQARDAAAADAEALQAEVLAVQTALEDAEAVRAQAEAARAQAASALDATAEEIAAKRGTAESELANVTGALRIGREELSALEETIAARRSELEAPIQEAAEAEALVEALADRSKALEAAISAAEAQLAGLTDGRSEAAGAAAEATAEIEQLTEARALVKSDLEAAQAELSQIEERLGAERAQMEAQLADLSVKLQSRQAELSAQQSAATALEARLVELADQTATEEAGYAERQARLDAELAKANERLEAARAAADQETARLTATIAEVDALAEQREAAVAALRDAETTAQSAISDRQANLAAEQAAVAGQISAARERLQNMTQSIAVQESLLTDAAAQKQQLEADIAALKAEMGELDASASTQSAALSGVLSEKSSLEGAIAALREQMAGLEADAAAQMAALSDAAEEKARLEQELASLRVEVADGDAAKVARAAALADVAKAQDQLTALREQIKSEEARRLALATAPEAEVEAPEAAPETGSVTAATAPAARAETQERVGRDAETVRQALVGLPELDKLSAAQRQTLEAELVGGACLTEALEVSAGRINRLMLAGLMRKLDMCTR